MNKDSKIYVAGHRGLVGSALMRKLQGEGYGNLLIRTSEELDLTRQSDVEEFFQENRPEYVLMAAAKVGGIRANNIYPADFIFDNLMIQSNIIHASYKYGVSRLLFLGSSCIYPKHCPQPMKEEYLLTGVLEPTNEPYAVAKIAGIKMCQSYNRQYGTNYIAVMPTNLYGPNDNFDLLNSHVLPALIRKFHEAKLSDARAVAVWGTGSPFREFLHVDDLADACLFLMKLPDDTFSDLLDHKRAPALINTGSEEEHTIGELALLVKEVVGFDGEIIFDTAKPDGTHRKLLDVSRLHNMGWRHRIGLREGLKSTYEWYMGACAGAADENAGSQPCVKGLH